MSIKIQTPKLQEILFHQLKSEVLPPQDADLLEDPARCLLSDLVSLPPSSNDPLHRATSAVSHPSYLEANYIQKYNSAVAGAFESLIRELIKVNPKAIQTLTQQHRYLQTPTGLRVMQQAIQEANLVELGRLIKEQTLTPAQVRTLLDEDPQAKEFVQNHLKDLTNSAKTARLTAIPPEAIAAVSFKDLSNKDLAIVLKNCACYGHVGVLEAIRVSASDKVDQETYVMAVGFAADRGIGASVALLRKFPQASACTWQQVGMLLVVAAEAGRTQAVRELLAFPAARQIPKRQIAMCQFIASRNNHNECANVLEVFSAQNIVSSSHQIPANIDPSSLEIKDSK